MSKLFGASYHWTTILLYILILLGIFVAGTFFSAKYSHEDGRDKTDSNNPVGHTKESYTSYASGSYSNIL
jgi:hypothetical protein